ncbi:hypothetical protein llap_9860 [Limosa lapponica baueri]|uniref:Uncharacterized protein n=1 Tax=Limosa lapponica baueri TaxID=1758121 RepID=A0A2I0U196_LIMLA|nr:hypothetical protein llap_9860 [Limosa lapponica baueri]
MATSRVKASQEWSMVTWQAGAVTSAQGPRMWSGKSWSGSGPETVIRVRHCPVVTQNGHQDETGPSSARKPGLSPGQDGGGTSLSADVAVTRLRCHPGSSWWYSHCLKVTPLGRESQGLAFTFTTALTGNEDTPGLGQLNSLTQPSNLLEADVLQALRITESQNDVRLEGSFGDHLVQLPCQSRST